jgi:hypothetical protein
MQEVVQKPTVKNYNCETSKNAPTNGSVLTRRAVYGYLIPLFDIWPHLQDFDIVTYYLINIQTIQSRRCYIPIAHRTLFENALKPTVSSSQISVHSQISTFGNSSRSDTDMLFAI